MIRRRTGALYEDHPCGCHTRGKARTGARSMRKALDEFSTELLVNQQGLIVE